MEKQLWIINKSSDSLKICITELRKWMTFEPLRPVQLPLEIALIYVKKYVTIQICEHPEKYFKDNPLKKLIIRDAGIGDILMLEPCLRQLKIDNNIILTVATRYPEVLKNNPYIDKLIKMDKKEDLKGINFEDYDCWDDLRNYSETCVNREKKHRTDCYNQIFKCNIKDNQPYLYFDKVEKSILKKKKDLRYIGVNFDASHQYRRYEKGKEAIEYLLQIDKDNVIVILGHYKFIDIKKNKRIIDLQGQTDIKQLINIILDLDYLIAVDSGVMHIALTVHTPTVGIYSIIHPHLRMNYYKGHYRVIFPEKMSCKGCGSHHMAICEFGDKKKNPDFIPPCMNINADIMWQKLIEMPLNPDKRIFMKNEKSEIKKVLEPIKNININKLSGRKLTLACIALDEEHNMPHFINEVMNNKAIGRTIVIDGGSKDKTVEMLTKVGAEVYVHPYIKTYFEQQAMQRNISMSYVAIGVPVLIMDFDEVYSKELSDYLPYLAEQREHSYGLIYRKTFNFYADIFDDTKRIKDFPDPQPRYFLWDKKFKFVGGAHHRTLNVPEPMIIKQPILHFEKENGRREIIEKQWATMMTGVRKYA